MAPDARARPESHCANFNGKYCKFTEHSGTASRYRELRNCSADLCIDLCLVLPGQTAGDYIAGFGPAIVGSRPFIRGSSSSAMGTRHRFHFWSTGISEVRLLLGKFLLA